MIARALYDQVTDRLKAVTSLSLRRQLKGILFRPRMATHAWRTLPDALIIGAQRCGTSSLFRYLGGHPDVMPSFRKEIGYFTVAYHLGQDWYRAHFPLRIERWLRSARSSSLVSFEATPDYLLDPRAPERAAKLVPAARIIVLLRDPVERALSHYDHNRRLGLESLSLLDAIEREEERVAEALRSMHREANFPLPVACRRYSYVTRGMYAVQIREWMQHYDANRFLIIRSEDFFHQTGEVFQQILAFLGLRAWQPPAFKNYSYVSHEKPSGTSQSTSERRLIRWALADRLAPANQMLADLLGRDFGWYPRGQASLAI